MQTIPLRLVPGADQRAALEDIVRSRACSVVFGLQGICSLSVAQLRYAFIDEPAELRGDLEILTRVWSLSVDGAHLHMSVSDRDGRVFGGHVAKGCIVRTTAEILVAELAEHRFSRETDPLTGFPELVVRPR